MSRHLMWRRELQQYNKASQNKDKNKNIKEYQKYLFHDEARLFSMEEGDLLGIFLYHVTIHHWSCTDPRDLLAMAPTSKA